MTGPGAVMPHASSLPSRSAAALPNSAAAAEIDAAKSEAFSELFAAVNGETELPGEREQDADAVRDENAGPIMPPIPMFPEKTPQARFAAELTATLPPEFVQGALLSAPPAAAPAAPEMVEVPKAPSSSASPVIGKPPVQPPLGREAAEPVSSALPDAAPEQAPATAYIPPVSAPAIPIRGPQEHIAAKALPQEGSSVGEPTSTPTATADPLVARAETAISENRSGQDGERGDTTRNAAVLKEAKVSVVLQETHFAPAPQQSPAFQIANRIIHDIQADPAFAAQAAELPQDASSAPLKVLHIKLDPPELGALTIRMSLKNDTLHLQIEASRHETARLIERDHDALSGMLRSAGYSIDGLSVQVTTGDRGNGAQQFSGGSGFNQSAGQHFAERQPEDSASRQASQRAPAPERITENGREIETPGAPGRRGGPVYL